MAKYFRKFGHGMHVIRVVLRNNANKLVEKTYLVLIGKATQDVGAVITIYEKCLEQIKVNMPHKKFLVENAGCYHNEVLFSWKAVATKKMLMLKINVTDTVLQQRDK